MITPLCAQIFAVLCSAAATIIGLIYGIFALIPYTPFDETNIGVGVTLIVLSATGIVGVAGALVGMGIGMLFSLPVMACDKP